MAVHKTSNGQFTADRPDTFDPENRKITLPINKFVHKKFQRGAYEILKKIKNPEKAVEAIFANLFTDEKKIGNNECFTYNLSNGNTRLFEDWPEQISGYCSAALSNPMDILSFYHIDPRRYYVNNKKTDYQTHVDIPFQAILQSSKSTKTTIIKTKGPCVGVKIYTALGYAPLDPLLISTQRYIYEECEKNGIPIINHGSSMGFYTCDRPFYYDLLKNDGHLSGEISETTKEIPNCNTEKEFPRYLKYRDKNGDILWKEPSDKTKKINWYCQNFTDPGAWEKVVTKEFPMLKLCLAHFTGDEHFKESRKGTNDIKKYDPYDSVHSWTNSGGEKLYPSFNTHKDDMEKMFDKYKLERICSISRKKRTRRLIKRKLTGIFMTLSP